MQQVRLWEKLSEIPARYASLEQWIEDWLADDRRATSAGLSG